MFGIQFRIVPRCLRGTFFWALLLPLVAVADPYRPQDADTVLEKLPSSSLRPSAERIEDPETAAKLAKTYIERNRISGDARLLGYAKAVLTPWWEQADAPIAVILMRATLKQALHDFDSALADLDLILGRDADNAQAWLTRASVLKVQGRFAEAAKACAQLSGQVDEVIEKICTLSVRSLSGELGPALNDLDDMRRSVLYQPRAIISWFYLERTDAQVRAGKLDSARRSFNYALSRFPEDIPLRASYADLLLQQKSYAELLELIPNDTSSETLYLRRALALMALKDPEFRSANRRMRSSFRAARRRGESLHLREEVRYRLAAGDDIDKIIPLAQANWAVQREPWDARLLIDCANRAGNSRLARPVARWLKQTGLQDARIPPIAKP